MTLYTEGGREGGSCGLLFLDWLGRVEINLFFLNFFFSWKGGEGGWGGLVRLILETNESEVWEIGFGVGRFVGGVGWEGGMLGDGGDLGDFKKKGNGVDLACYYMTLPLSCVSIRKVNSILLGKASISRAVFPSYYQRGHFF